MNADTTKEEFEIIVKICERAEKSPNHKRSRLGMLMDLEVVHGSDMKLDLKKLLNAPEYDFWHDINGIIKYLNRHSLELEGCFVPRCIKHEVDNSHKYYRFSDDDGNTLHTGYNSTSREEAMQSYLELIEPEIDDGICDELKAKLNTGKLDEIVGFIKSQGYRLEESEKKFMEG